LPRPNGASRPSPRCTSAARSPAQAGATIEAKGRDLGRFLTFYHRLYGHDRSDEWYTSVTREFLKQLAKARPAQATIIRTLDVGEVVVEGAMVT
jgi:hypothetical protein